MEPDINELQEDVEVTVVTPTRTMEDTKKCNSCLVNAVANYCLECKQYYCTLCSNYHKNMTASKRHELWDMNSTDYIKKKKTIEFNDCDIHKEQFLETFCITCNKYSCPRCIVPNHNQHELQDITTRFGNYYDIFNNKIEETNKGVQLLRIEFIKQENHLNELKKSVTDVIKTITDKESEIKILLRNYSVALIESTINANFNNFTQEYNNYAKYINDCIATLNQFKIKKETELNHLNTKSIVTLPETTVNEAMPINTCNPFLCEFNINFIPSSSTKETFDSNIATMFGSLACSMEKDTEALVAARPAISLL